MKKTEVISSVACAMAGAAAFTMMAKLMDAPSSTRPVLIRNSVRNPGESLSRRFSALSSALPSRPKMMAYTGYSIVPSQLTEVPFVQIGTYSDRYHAAVPRITTTASPPMIHCRGPLGRGSSSSSSRDACTALASSSFSSSFALIGLMSVIG